MLGSAFDDVIAGTAGSNALDGGAGVDELNYYGATQGVRVDLYGGGALDGAAYDTLRNFENVLGSTFDDVIAGTTGSNVLNGGGGIDEVNYYGATQGARVDLYGGGALDGAAYDTLLSFENVFGSAFDDVIAGTTGSNVLNGGGGIDEVNYYGAAQGVTVNLAGGWATEGSATDTLLNFENMFGSAFNDVIIGSAGSNVLDGSAGQDTLTGGAGDDVFVFARGQAHGDMIADFDGGGAAAGDQLRFVGYGPGATLTQLDAAHWIVHSGDGLVHETIAFQHGPLVHPSDVLFV